MLDSAIVPPAWRRYLAYVTIALMPISLNVEKLVGARARTYFSPLDVLLPVLALLLIWDLLQRKPWARFAVPPLPGILWALLAVASWTWAESLPFAGALKAWAKGPLFFGVVAVWVFQNLAFSVGEFRRLALVLGASFSLCLLMALVQYAGPRGFPYDPQDPTAKLIGASNVRVAGWYEFRSMLGAQLAMLLPAAVAFALLDKDDAVRWSAAAIAVVGLCVALSPAGLIGAAAGIVAVACAYGVRRLWLTGATVLALLLLVLAVLLPKLPRHNTEVVARGVALFALDGDLMKATARARRYQAELDLLTSQKDGAPVWQKGVGLDQFQPKVNLFYDKIYDVYPKPGHPTDAEYSFDMEADEPFTFGLLETIAVELGVPGLLVILFLFGTWLFAAHGAFALADDDVRAELALAALGAGCGALVASLFTNPAIRGIGGSFAFFFALALWLWHSRVVCAPAPDAAPTIETAQSRT
jgi:hypothetical protein